MSARSRRPESTPSAVRRPPAYRVRRSSIHGRGVFAGAAFARGDRVGEYRGQVIDRAEMERRWRGVARDSSHTFFFIVDEDRVIDAGVRGNGIRFINHSCAPNCVTESEGGRVFVRALRAIAPGEELTYDYLLEPGDPADAFEHYACACGAGSCRGTMADPSSLPPALRRAARKAAQKRAVR